MFAIDTIDGKGVITLIGQLDYEQRPLYQLRIQAIDRAIEHERLSTSTSILISVEDCEDQPPMFTFAPSITRLPEDLAVGSAILRLSAIDGDRGVNNPIKYSIVSVNGHESGFERNLFSIGSDSGQISVAHELDRELTLDGPLGDPASGSDASAGSGSRSKQLAGGSSNQPGAYVIQVRATEVSSSGESDLGEPDELAANSVSTELTVILTDVNDETPTFNRPKFYGELLENSAPESLVNFVAAPAASSGPTSGPSSYQLSQLAGARVFDRDQGTNGTFTVHLEGEHGHLFDVWPSEATNEAQLMIKVSAVAMQQANAKYFDYERTKELRLTIVAREKYPPRGAGQQQQQQQQRRFSSAQMVIQLKDSNDNYPQFDSELYRVEIPENAQRGMHICVVKAVDADSGPFGSAGIRYTEIRGERANKFKLDPASGVITLRTNEHGFDREQIGQHHLIVEARDNNGLGNRNTTQLLIVLTDVNDQRPKFALDQYEAFIYENELDFQSPLQVQAVDADAPGSQNSRITYSIVGGDPQQNFTIDPQTGRIRVKTSLVAAPPALGPHPGPLAPVQPYSSQAHSARNGRNGHSDQVESDIIVADSVLSPASSSPSSSGAGAAGNQHQQPLQAIGLDFERIAQRRDETRQFNLTVRAQDSGLPEPLASTTQVIVLVYDKNDHAPVFSRSLYSKSVREDATGGSAVIQVQAHDGDHSPANSKIAYRISSGASDKFSIDSDTGLISVANGANLDIDRVQGGGQRRTNYLLSVLAFDGSFGANQKSSSALVNISIIDVNNKAPEFVSLGAGLVGGGNGYLGSALQLQQQQQQQPAQSGKHQLLLLNGASSQTSAAGQQQQQQLSNVVSVSEDAPYGLIVTRAFASDLDSSAELRYSINYAWSEARNEEMMLVDPSLYRDVFTIEPVDGTIKVSRQLDRELFDQVKLRLQVEDLAAQTPDQVAHTYLFVRITDVNDNRPTFKKSLYKAVVNENSISGTSVITLAADDRDLNKTVRYSLEAATPELARLVRINPRSGEVTVNDKIDRELYPLINVTIKAEDSGQPHSLTGTTQLLVTVRDENDNNPIFVNATHLKPAASRADEASGGEGGGGAGLSVRQAPSEEQPRNHNMHHNQAIANNNGNSYRLRSLGPPLETGSNSADPSTPVLDILSHDERMHAPATGGTALDHSGRELTLLAPGATASVREDAPVGQQIAYVRADDADVGNNGRVTYLLDAASSGAKFRIDRDSGVLSVAQALDREQQNHYTLIIEACDNYDLGYSTGESRRAFTQVNILVTDINDNPPLVSTNLHVHHPGTRASITTSASGYASGSDRSPTPSPSPSASLLSLSSPFTYPTYDRAMSSPGPHELPLADCLFINEFQPLNEPILTLTATDLDDPLTANGQIDLAIVNNLPQNELFSLVPIKSSQSGGPLATSDDQTVPLAPTTTRPPTAASTGQPAGDSSAAVSSTSADSIGFGDLLLGSESSSNLLPRGRRQRRSIDDDEPRSLEPGNFYTSIGSNSRANNKLRTQQTAAIIGGSSSSSSSSSTGSTGSTGTSYSVQGQPISSGEQQMHVVVSQSLKERVGNYTILVRATDRGQPIALTSMKMINVCVEDVNNHAPVFTRPALNHTIRVMENATVGSFVAQVEATDLDHGLNGELQYSLKPTGIQNGNSDWQSFKIDRLSGVISTTRTFNRLVKRYYTLRVQAQDLGRPTSLSSDIDINIMIVNSGKYQPEFEAQQQSLQFTENTLPGQEWFTLLPTANLDDDPALINAGPATAVDSSGQRGRALNSGPTAGQNWLSSPCYYIVDGDDHEQVFHLDRYTHRLTNQKELDRERKANYTLIVKASNDCSGRPAGNQQVHHLLQSFSSVAAATAATTTTPTTTGDSITAATTSAASLLDSGEARRFARSSSDQSEPATSGRVRPGASRRAHYSDGTGSDHSQPDEHHQQLSSALSSDKGAPQAPALATGANWDALVANDKSLLKVSVKIRDLNDNAPKFTQRIYTGGLTTEADFGTVFMIVQAVDLDADTNGQLTYSLVKPIKRQLSLDSEPIGPVGQSQSNSGQETATVPALTRQKRAVQMSATATTLRPGGGQQQSFSAHNTNTSNAEVYIQAPPAGVESKQVQPASNELAPASGGGNSNQQLAATSLDGDELFVINSQTGEISLNFDPQKHMKGYFEFEIVARDTDGLTDTAKVFIYLLRQDQRVKFVLRLTPQELRQRLNKFRSVMGNITGAIVNIDSYKYFENGHDGSVDKKKTSLYLHFVNPDDNTIIDVDKVLTMIDNNIEYLDELYKEFHVLSSEAAYLPLSSGALVDPIDQVRTGLMGVSFFLALILVLVIGLCLNQRTRYERQLKAATVSAFGGSPLHGLEPGGYHSQTNLPNTNLHSQDPNPIWISGHFGNGQLVGASDSQAADSDQHYSHQQPQQRQHQLSTASANKRPGSGGASQRQQHQQPSSGGQTQLELAHEHQLRDQRAAGKAAHHHKLFHSASSGVGMALDDDDDDDVDLDDELDCLSSSAGDHSSDLNSLNGGTGSVNQHHHQHHHQLGRHHHQYQVATATATPRDSLSSSHGQVSSSSGSNSASTTNERQALCSPTANNSGGNSAAGSKLVRGQKVQQSPSSKQNQTKLKLNGSANSRSLAAVDHTMTTTTSGSTFGAAFKEVTIYTDHQRQHQPSGRAVGPTTMNDRNCSFNQLVADHSHQLQQQQQQQQQPSNGKNLVRITTTTANVNQQQHQPTSHVNKLANQFNAAKLQKQSIYVTTSQHQQEQEQQAAGVNKLIESGNNMRQAQQQKARIVVHSNGSDVNQGIIKNALQQAANNIGCNKKMNDNLDAKFVPPATQHEQQQLDHNVDNFETSLSKLSILNLETTEL